MADIRSSVDRPVAIRQHLTAGNNFSGVTPADGGGAMTPTFASDIYKFDDMTAGGLFDPTNAMYEFERSDALYLIAAEMKLADQSSWKLERVDVDSNVVEIFTGTTGTYFNYSESDKVVLLWGSTLKLTTVAASAAMTATLIFIPYKYARG